MAMIKRERTNIHKLLHMLWGKAIDTEDYNKTEWMELQQWIDEFENKPIDNSDITVSEVLSFTISKIKLTRKFHHATRARDCWCLFVNNIHSDMCLAMTKVLYTLEDVYARRGRELKNKIENEQ